MKKHHVTANLIFPIRTGITLVGILGFDMLGKPREWDTSEVAILRASVDIIANAWIRQQEIDYRKEKEREAEQSRLLVIRADRLAALGTMTAGIIHEITQPLNTINVSTQTILYGLSRGWELDDEKVPKSLDLIVDQIKRINEIITILTYSSDNSTIVLEVIDNGPGIPADIREKIFDPFFTTKDVGKGTGLGLSISSGIVRDHNGVLDVQSNENEGATFIVRLPVVPT